MIQTESSLYLQQPEILSQEKFETLQEGIGGIRHSLKVAGRMLGKQEGEEKPSGYEPEYHRLSPGEEWSERLGYYGSTLSTIAGRLFKRKKGVGIVAGSAAALFSTTPVAAHVIDMSKELINSEAAFQEDEACTPATVSWNPYTGLLSTEVTKYDEVHGFPSLYGEDGAMEATLEANDIEVDSKGTPTSIRGQDVLQKDAAGNSVSWQVTIPCPSDLPPVTATEGATEEAVTDQQGVSTEEAPQTTETTNTLQNEAEQVAEAEESDGKIPWRNIAIIGGSLVVVAGIALWLNARRK